MNKQPLFPAALALVMGAFLAPVFWPYRTAVCAVAIAAGIAMAVWFWWRRELSLAAALTALLLAGIILPPPPLPPGQVARVTALRGWMDGETQIKSDRVYYGCRIVAWRLGGPDWTRPPRSFRVWMAGDNQPDLTYGRWFEAYGGFYAMPVDGREGYLFAKGLYLLQRVSSNPLYQAILHLRTAMERVYRQYLDPDERALLAGLVFGDLPRLPAGVMSAFADAGVVHLLSVGGLHLGFILAGILGLAALLGWRDWRAWALAVPLLLAYVMLCGPKPPVLRAFVTASAVGIGAVKRYRAGSVNMLGLAAIIVTVWQPWAVRTLSYQLSFAAAAGLVLLYPRMLEWCPDRYKFFGRPLLISLAATLTVLPIQTTVFGRVSLIAPLANLAMVPLAGLAVQIGLAAGLLGSCLPWLAAPLLSAVNVMLHLLIWLARFFAGIPGAAVNSGVWPWPIMLCYLACLGSLVYGLERNILSKKARWGFAPLGLVLAAMAALTIWWQVLAVPKGLTISIIDVGQGDAIYVRAPGGRTMLVDGGDETAGTRVLGYLRRQGVNRLDLLVVSHPHSDHIGGLMAVANGMSIGQVLDPGWPDPLPCYQGFLALLRSRGIKWQRARRGLSFSLGPEVQGVVLFPLMDEPQPENLNNGSLVLRLRYKGRAILFPGDLEQEGEQELLAAGDDLRSTLLKVGHHGSATSTGAAWLAAVRPGSVVISVGRHNPFNHPSPDTISRLQTAKVETYRTDELGTVIYRVDGGRWAMTVQWANRN